MAKIIKEEKRNRASYYDLNVEPALGCQSDYEDLPHRPPFLVDKILEISKQHVVAVKSVTMNEPFFQRAFPWTTCNARCSAN